MLDSRHLRSNEAGLTLVELVIVIIIIGIIAAVAMMQTKTSTTTFKRENIGRELKIAFERARFDSVKRRAECAANQSQVVVNSTSFEVTTYEGNPLSAKAFTTDFAGQGFAITPSGTASLPVTVKFNQRGEVAGGAADASFRVCEGTCTSTNSNTVLISPTGTVNFLKGLASSPSFAEPGGVSAPTDTVNDGIILPSAGACF